MNTNPQHALCVMRILAGMPGAEMLHMVTRAEFSDAEGAEFKGHCESFTPDRLPESVQLEQGTAHVLLLVEGSAPAINPSPDFSQIFRNLCYQAHVENSVPLRIEMRESGSLRKFFIECEL